MYTLALISLTWLGITTLNLIVEDWSWAMVDWSCRRLNGQEGN
jgi:hypothetical protein